MKSALNKNNKKCKSPPVFVEEQPKPDMACTLLFLKKGFLGIHSFVITLLLVGIGHARIDILKKSQKDDPNLILLTLYMECSGLVKINL